jgi:hypothetical protein
MTFAVLLLLGLVALALHLIYNYIIHLPTRTVNTFNHFSDFLIIFLCFVCPVTSPLTKRKTNWIISLFFYALNALSYH